MELPVEQFGRIYEEVYDRLEGPVLELMEKVMDHVDQVADEFGIDDVKRSKLWMASLLLVMPVDIAQSYIDRFDIDDDVIEMVNPLPTNVVVWKTIPRAAMLAELANGDVAVSRWYHLADTMGLAEFDEYTPRPKTEEELEAMVSRNYAREDGRTTFIDHFYSSLLRTPIDVGVVGSKYLDEVVMSGRRSLIEFVMRFSREGRIRF